MPKGMTPNESGIRIEITQPGTLAPPIVVYITWGLKHMAAARHISVETAGDDAPVAGTIRPAAADDLEQSIEAWLAHLRVQGRSANTIRSYRSMFARARREAGWSRLSQISYAAIIDYLDSRRAAWKAETYNCQLTAFRSFAKHLCRVDQAWSTVLKQIDAADRCSGQPSDGARAATTPEARDLIATAAGRCLDGRSRSPRVPIYKFMFLAGLRGEEPGVLRWRHVVLDDDVPHIWWGGRLGAPHKAARQQRVAILPELADVLRAHRASSTSAGPDDRLFAALPPRAVWDSDREISGISKIDDRGRTFTRHSARKWLATTLANHGVDGKYVDWFMRHRGKVEARYFDPSLADQAAVLRTLPVFFCDHVDNLPESADTLGGTRRQAPGTPLNQISSNPPVAAKVLRVPNCDASSVTAGGFVLSGSASVGVEIVAKVREECVSITPTFLT